MDLSKDKTVEQIISRLAAAETGDRAVKVEGTWGSFAPLLASHISERLKKPILYISPHIDDADNVVDDLQVFGKKTVEAFPAWEAEAGIADATDEIAAERTRIALSLWELKKSGRKSSDIIISTSIQALCQPVAEPEAIKQSGLMLKRGQTVEPGLVISWLVDNNFERVDLIDMPGQFAQRGGIIDIFAPIAVLAAQASSNPSVQQAVRIEFFGDEIESIRKIDLDSQRSTESIDGVNIVSSSGRQKQKQTQLLINILPPDTIILLEEPTDIEEVAKVFMDRLDNPDGFHSWENCYRAIEGFTQLYISRFAAAGDDEYLKLNVKSTQQFEHRAGTVQTGLGGSKAALDELLQLAAEGKEVLLYCENEAEIKRVTEILNQSGKPIPASFKFEHGFITQGFIIDSLNAIVVTHHQIFGQYTVRRRIRAIRPTAPVESFLDLQKGDYVVHASNGIGRFIGIRSINQKEGPSEYLTIEYAEKEIIYVPVQNISLVHKYVGALPRRPQLSRIGSKKWNRQKETVAAAVKDLAADLLELQARRQSTGGIAFCRDGSWQQEFEESFLYQETPDQIRAAEQIKSDMQKPVPMDRLLCGDVGYGKTELAMRAAFKAVESGKQVAVLVPTTVLCVQHGRTFAERFADFPVSIEILNRFKTSGEVKRIEAQAKHGKIDILIGTHKLLSDKVGFSDLGLLIIDEEQRFGVEHKEKLKKARVNVDVLTMTATPIPRTLHLSLLGLRDISSLATPPLDRRSIATTVFRYDEAAIRKGILRELNRQGQVFFLHNRVQSIKKMAERIKAIVPEARVDIAHGQMHKHELENAMVKFVLGQTDVLVCTTIIESGLDIPNANTIFINDADRFGLAELHQLRGRVGRYKHRAYACMLLPVTRTITPEAVKRLKAIEEYSQLGAGFKIALRDLEIRGAGNLLGAEQSGHIQLVGYEMYCRLLSESVKRLKNEPVERPPATILELGFSAYIPKSYIVSDRQRLDVYRRIAEALYIEDIKRLKDDITDIFGPPPDEIRLLLQSAELKMLADGWNVKSIVVSGQDVIFSFDETEQAGKLFAKAPGKMCIPDPKTVYLRLQKGYFEPKTLLSVLRKIFRTRKPAAV